jgi:glutathione peroxidase
MGGLSGKERMIHAPANAAPSISIYDLSLELIDGEQFDLATCKGKKLLLVNTASDCGFTPQYEGLQALHEKYGDQVVIIGFPANDFKQQEKKNNSDIATFCKRNYGVTFLLAAKTSVRKGPAQHPVFRWLTDPQQNGWNSKTPSWNFSKYLVDEQGRLMHYFEPGVDPGEEAFRKFFEG